MASGTLNTRSATIHSFGNSTAGTAVIVPAFTLQPPASPNRYSRASIFALLITVSAAETITIQDTTGAALSQAIQLVANGSICLDMLSNGDMWWQGAPGAGLQIVQSVPGTALGYDVWWNAAP